MKCLIENKDSEIIIKNSRFITSLIKIDETSNIKDLIKSQVMMVNQVVQLVFLC